MYHQRFKGDHYGMGLKLGWMLKKQYINFDKIIVLNDFHRDYGAKSLRVLTEVFPEVCDEIRGITDALSYSYQTFASWLLCMACCLKGCTAFTFKQNGRVIYGRNNDLPPELKKNSQSVLYRPDTGFAFLGNTSAMVNLEEGINEKGLAVAMLFVLPKIVKPGLSSVFVVRYLLEKCASADEAIRTLRTVPIASACNILVADKTGAMAVAECIPDRMSIRKPADGESFLIAANHFISDEMQDQNPTDDSFHSGLRYRTIYKVLKEGSAEDGVEQSKLILSGRHGFVCQYEKALNCETIWSSVFDITGGKIYRSEGDPRRNKYIEDCRLTIAD